jgi:hypothetical protein
MRESMQQEKESRGGRPRKGTDIREELWRARATARAILRAYATELELPRDIEQQLLGTRLKIRNEDLARLAKCFPLAADTAQKAHRWDLETLRSILSWDDPVTLVVAHFTVDHSWWEIIRDVEETPCSAEQEEAIRSAISSHYQAQATRPEDPWLVKDWPLFLENSIQRKKSLR